MKSSDVIDEVLLEKDYSPTETTLSSTTTREKDFLSGNEIEREKDYFNGESLYIGYERIYGNSIYDIPITVFEQVELSRYKDVIKLIGEQKVYHISGLVKQFPFATRYKIEIVQEILIRRGLLLAIPTPGKAHSTMGMMLLCTKDCTQDDIDNYLISFNAHDRLRYIKQKQRAKKKKSPKEIVDHNKEVSELSKLEKVLDGVLDICTCNHALAEHYEETICSVAKCGCDEYMKKESVPRAKK